MNDFKQPIYPSKSISGIRMDDTNRFETRYDTGDSSVCVQRMRNVCVYGIEEG